MICPKCGQNEPEGSKFCQKCGAKLTIDEAAESVNEEAAEVAEERNIIEETAGAEQALAGAKAMSESAPAMTQTAATSTVKTAATAGGTVAAKTGAKLPLIFGLIGGGVFLVAAAVTLVIVFVVNGKSSSINLSDYTEVTFEGVDGKGEAKAEFKYIDLVLKLAEDMGVDTSEARKIQDGKYDEKDFENMDFDDLKGIAGIAKSFFGDLGEYMTIVSAIDGIKIKVDKDSGLSNGDTVHVTYKINEENIKKLKTEIVADELTVKVSGLTEVKEVDPFESVNIHVDGTSPKAYVYCDSSSDEDYMAFIGFTAKPSEGLMRGDSITITVNGYDEEQFSDKYGVKFSRTAMEYSLDDVDSYIAVQGALEQPALDTMKSSTEEYVKQYFEDSARAKAIKGTDIKYAGYYLLTRKDMDAWSGYNKVYLVYSANVSSKEKPKGFKTKKVYFPVEYDDVKRLADGSYDIETSYRRIIGSTDLKFGFWQMVDGYTDVDTMFDELVTADDSEYDGAGYDGLEG